MQVSPTVVPFNLDNDSEVSELVVVRRNFLCSLAEVSWSTRTTACRRAVGLCFGLTWFLVLCVDCRVFLWLLRSVRLCFCSEQHISYCISGRSRRAANWLRLFLGVPFRSRVVCTSLCSSSRWCVPTVLWWPTTMRFSSSWSRFNAHQLLEPRGAAAVKLFSNWRFPFGQKSFSFLMLCLSTMSNETIDRYFEEPAIFACVGGRRPLFSEECVLCSCCARS